MSAVMTNLQVSQDKVQLLMAQKCMNPYDLCSKEQIRGLQESACMGILVSLDSPVMGLDGGEDTTVGDLVASGQNMEEDTIDCLDHERLCMVLWECVDSLEGRQPEVIRKRYQDGLTLAGVGEACGVTPEVVRQDINKALRELRRTRNSNRLRPYLETGIFFNKPLNSNRGICAKIAVKTDTAVFLQNPTGFDMRGRRRYGKQTGAASAI